VRRNTRISEASELKNATSTVEMGRLRMKSRKTGSGIQSVNAVSRSFFQGSDDRISPAER